MSLAALLADDAGINARIAASVLLAAYLAVAAILLPREISFLAGVKQPQRARFIAMDVIIQICVLAVLLPSIMYEKLNLAMLYLVVTGFTFLWIVAALNARSRYIYTHAILRESMLESKRQLEQLVKEKRAEDGKSD